MQRTCIPGCRGRCPHRPVGKLRMCRRFPLKRCILPGRRGHRPLQCAAQICGCPTGGAEPRPYQLCSRQAAFCIKTEFPCGTGNVRMGIACFLCLNDVSFFDYRLDQIAAKAVADIVQILCVPDENVRLLPRLDGADAVGAADGGGAVERHRGQRLLRR